MMTETSADGLGLQNHDLDFGLTQFKYLRSQCNFPWLLANVLDPALGKDVALAGCPKTAMLKSSNGIKVGFIGLGEREWYREIRSFGFKIAVMITWR